MSRSTATPGPEPGPTPPGSVHIGRGPNAIATPVAARLATEPLRREFDDIRSQLACVIESLAAVHQRIDDLATRLSTAD